MSIYDTLNEQQKEAVFQTEGPVLILAGAGSGKTRVLTHRIAYLIDRCNVNPWSIMAITFTNKAAGEMRERVDDIVGFGSESIWVSTFHSSCVRILRRYIDKLGYDNNFTIYDTDDQKTVMKDICKRLEIDTKMLKERTILSAISSAKNEYISPVEYELAAGGDYTLKRISKVYAEYQRVLKKNNALDFDDLLVKAVELLKACPDVQEYYQNRFQYIMVDEYQDTNTVQFEFIRLLASKNRNLCVVGDDDQSIYKFRGAEVQNILQFPNHFPETKIIRLERNYRSTGKILAAADAVVSNNTDRLGKTLVADRGEGKAPVLVFLENQDKEAAFCAQLIEKAVETQGAHYSDFAVLYRTNAQSLTFETEFLHRKIPYAVVGSLKFYEREEIKDLLSYLSLLANPRDELAFGRIVNKPVRGIGEKSQEKIIESAYSTAGALIENLNLVDSAENCAESLSKKARDGIKEFCSMMKKLAAELDEKSEEAPEEPLIQILAEKAAAENSEERDVVEAEKADYERLSVFIQKVIEDSGLDEYHRSQDEVDGTNRVQNLQELVNSAVLYPFSRQGLLDFLDSIELDRSLAEQNDDSADAVTLITLHNTKGLEFNRVIITGLENGIFPREDKIGDELEEERRLFYVGITRARNELYITTCAMRRLYGRTQQMIPSRFLIEAGNVFTCLGRIPSSYSRLISGGADCADGEEPSPKAELLEKWKKGVRLYNDDYGYGQIVKSDANSGEVVIEVQFENGERKKFMPEYQGRKLDIIKD